MNNVSFCGAKVYSNPNMYIKNAKASEIAEAIKIGVKQAGEELGMKLSHPHCERMSGTLLKKTNPDSFDKDTDKLSEYGRIGFNNIYGQQFNVTTDSKLKDLMHCARDVAYMTANDDGIISYSFKYLA